MADLNLFNVLAPPTNEDNLEPQPIVETVADPTLNSSAHHPEELSGDFQPVVKKTKTRNPKPANPEPANPIQESKPRPVPYIPGPPETYFSINAARGDNYNFPKSNSSKWTQEKVSEMKEHQAKSKARKAELKAHKEDIQSKGNESRRERAAEMKGRMAEFQAHKDEVKKHENSERKIEKLKDGQYVAKEKEPKSRNRVPRWFVV